MIKIPKYKNSWIPSEISKLNPQKQSTKAKVVGSICQYAKKVSTIDDELKQVTRSIWTRRIYFLIFVLNSGIGQD